MKITDLFSIAKGQKAPEFSDIPFDGSIRFIQIDDLRTDDNLKYCKDNTKLVHCKPGDVIIAWDGANAGTIGYGLTGIIGSTLAKLTPKKAVVDTPYAGYFLKSKFKYLRENCTGATIPHISRQSLETLEIPLPTLSEQQHITRVLDQADRLRQQDRKLLAHYDALVQSVFMELFGDQNPAAAKWPEKTIAELAQATKNSMRTGPFGSDLLHSEFVEEGTFVLGIDNVVNNRFEWAKPRFITGKKYEKLKRYTVYPGDVLISIMGTIGRTAVVPDDIPAAINSKHLAAITLNQNLALPTFVSYSLYADPRIVRQLSARSKGAIMDGLNLGIIKDTKLLLPPLPLQQKFAAIVAQIEQQKAAVQQQQAYSEALFQSLLQQAFRGELGGASAD